VQSALERRKEILDVMNIRRYDTVSILAFEFGVSAWTIRRDVSILSLEYPIYCKHGGCGGVYVEAGCSIGRKRMSDAQAELLERLLPGLGADDTETMRSIIKTFAVPKKGEKRR